MRALVLPPWPSATKTSPLGATKTADGALNSSLPAPATPALPSVSRSLPSGAELEDLMTLAVLAEAVGEPDIAVAIDMDAVRKDGEAGAETLHQPAGCVELEDRIELRAFAGKGHACLQLAGRCEARRSARRPRRSCRRDRYRRRWSSPRSGLPAIAPSCRSRGKDSAASWSALRPGVRASPPKIATAAATASANAWRACCGI